MSLNQHIGSGSFSEVFKVKRVADNKIYALKKVRVTLWVLSFGGVRWFEMNKFYFNWRNRNSLINVFRNILISSNLGAAEPAGREGERELS